MDFVLTILRQARSCAPPRGFSENQTLSQRIIISWGRRLRRGWVATKFAPRSTRRDHPRPGPAPALPAAGPARQLSFTFLRSRRSSEVSLPPPRLPGRPLLRSPEGSGWGVEGRLGSRRAGRPPLPTKVRRGAATVAAGTAAALGEEGRALPAAEPVPPPSMPRGCGARRSPLSRFPRQQAGAGGRVGMRLERPGKGPKEGGRRGIRGAGPGN